MASSIADFDTEINSILDTRPPVSASKINGLVKLAVKYTRVKTIYVLLIVSITRLSYSRLRSFLQRVSLSLSYPESTSWTLLQRLSPNRAVILNKYYLSQGNEADALLVLFEEKLDVFFKSAMSASAKDKVRQ